MQSLNGKFVVLGVSASIAAYKAASFASLLKKHGANVQVIMTKNAQNLINPITFEQLTGNKCLTNTFDREFEFKVEHVSLAQKADLFIIAPATANVIAKVSHGLADDMLTTTFLACTCQKLIAPAMNTRMFLNPITQENLKTCERFGIQIISPASGFLACGETGSGRLPEPEELLSYTEHFIAEEKTLTGKKILITAGPTCESIDPVRYITNHSSGKMGYALAKIASERGADVTLISGKVSLKPLMFVKNVSVTSAKEMSDAVKAHSENADVIIMAAAVADYTPVNVSEQKIKKHDSNGEPLQLELKRTEDILSYLGKHRKSGQVLCGFSMETQNLEQNSIRKLQEKNADLIVANSLVEKGAGFAVDTNRVTIFTKNQKKEFPLLEKTEVARVILDEVQNELFKNSDN